MSNHRPCPRRLCVNDVNLENPQLKVYRFARLVFGLYSSPFLLNATMAHHITNHHVASQFAEEILRSLYVDDYVGGADSEESVSDRQHLLKSSFKDDGLNMRKWSTNSIMVQGKINQTESVVALLETQPAQDIEEEVITYADFLFNVKAPQVLSQDKEEDNLKFEFDNILSKVPLTKREILIKRLSFMIPLDSPVQS